MCEDMKIFLKHILRNIRDNVSRTTLILVSLFGVGVIISIAFGAIFTLDSLITSIRNSMSSVQYIVYSSTEEKITYDRVKQTNNDFAYLGVPEYNYGYIYDTEGNEFVSFPLVGLDLKNAEKLNSVVVKNTKDLVLGENEVIVSKSTADTYKLKEGDTLEYFDEDGNKHIFKIKYIANNSGFFNSFNVEGVSVVTNESEYLKISRKDKIEYDSLHLRYLGNKNIDKLTEELYSVEDDYGLDFTYISNTSVSDIFGNYIKIAVVAIVLVIVLVFFTVNSIVKIIMNERIPVIGTFRSVGASSKKMNSLLILEMATYGLIGGFLGSFIGVALIKGLFKIFELFGDTLMFDISMVNFEKYSVYTVVITVLFLILFQISLSISEIIKSNKISIKDCIFNKHDSVYKYSVVRFVVGIFCLVIGIISIIFINKLTFAYCVIGIISLFISVAMLLPIITKFLMKFVNKNNNPVTEMAKNTVVNNKLQISSNIIISVMLMISLVSFSGLSYLIDSYKSKLDMVKSSMYVFSMSEKINLNSSFAGIDGVEKSASLYVSTMANEMYDELTFANHKVSKLAFIYSDSYKNLVDNSNILDIDYNLADNLTDNEVIVSNYFKDKYNLKIGDIVVIKGTIKNKRFTYSLPLNLKIVGFADMSKIDYMAVILSEKVVTNEITTFDKNYYFIELAKDAKYNDVKKKVLSELTYETPEIKSQEEYVEDINEQMRGTYVDIAVVILVIIGIALIGIINNQSVSFMERKKEIATLYSTSMSRKQINNMMLKELLLSYVVSSLVSLFFTLILIVLLRYTISMLGVYIPLSFNLFGIVILLLIIALIMGVIYLVMKKKIRKMNVVEELKYE